MTNQKHTILRIKGFTIIELIVVISVIGILATITVVGYGSWRTGVTAAQLKSDLNGAAAAMENARNFGNGYPVTVPASFTPSSGVTLAGGGLTGGKSFCIEATNGTQSYNISQFGAISVGVCPVLYFDAAITASYPGSGSSWIDLSGNGGDGALVNGTTFTSNNGGVLNFDGDNGRVEAAPQTYGNNTSWSACFNATQNMNSYNMFMGNVLPYFGLYIGNSIIFSNIVGGVQSSVISTANLTLNTWYCTTFTTQYDGTNTTMSIYINGSFAKNGIFPGTQGNYGYQFIAGDGRNSKWYPFKGMLSDVKILNHTMSADEVKQEFNSMRSRYGI